MTIYKTCSDCYRMKPIEDFHTDKSGAALVRGNCKQCECFKRRLRYYREINHQNRIKKSKGFKLCKQLSASY